MSAKIEMLGQRFGSLIVIGEGPRIRTEASWVCRCDCGNITVPIRGSSLRRGGSKSCGCGQRGKARKHGLSGSRLYRIWRNMKVRCYYPGHAQYGGYGGRGITVCPEWLSSFEIFSSWALSHGYTDELSIDRIDNERGYSPDNCRWATVQEQSQNKRKKNRRKNSNV